MSVQKPNQDDIRMALAEIGGALSEDDLDSAEKRAMDVLARIRRRKQEGGRK